MNNPTNNGRIRTSKVVNILINGLMMFAFPPPDGFIAAVAPIASAIMTPLPLFAITIPYLIYRRCNKEKYATVPTKNGKSTEMDEYPPDKTVK
jgi:hypothetical protein